MTTIDPTKLINSAKEEISSAVTKEDVDKKRAELLLLSNDGEIKKSEAYINKANAKTILKLYTEYAAAVQEKSVIFLSDLFLSKLSMVLGGLDAVENLTIWRRNYKEIHFYRKT